MVAENGRREQWNQVYPYLDGYWLGEHHNELRPDYWKVEETATGYLFTHYFRKESEVWKLHQQQFSVTFHRQWQRLCMRAASSVHTTMVE